MSQFLSLFLIIFALLAAAMALLAVRLFFGKRFVGTHVDQNRHLRAKGIHCVRAQDAVARRDKRQAVPERSSHAAEKSQSVNN